MRHATLITALAVMACTPAPSSDIIEPAPPAVEDTGDPPEPMDTGGMDTGTLAPALTHLDVIAVVDNSCSMMVEQQRLGAALDAWDPGVSWALHLVTTDDVIGPVDMGDIPAAITGVGIEGNPTEMGIEYAVHYLQQAGPVDDALLVVFLSDEQDSSWKLPTDLAGEMTAAAERHAVLALVSGDPTCPDAVEPGHGYLEAVDLIGGAHEEVCAPDYLPALQEVMDWI